MAPFFVVFQGTDIPGHGRPIFILDCRRLRGDYQAEVILLLPDMRTRTLAVQRRTCDFPVDMTSGLDEKEERTFIVDLLTDEARLVIGAVQEAEFQKTHNLFLGKECRLSECDPPTLRRLWLSGMPTKAQFDQIGEKSVCPQLEQFLNEVVDFPQIKFAENPYK